MMITTIRLRSPHKYTSRAICLMNNECLTDLFLLSFRKNTPCAICRLWQEPAAPLSTSSRSRSKRDDAPMNLRSNTPSICPLKNRKLRKSTIKTSEWPKELFTASQMYRLKMFMKSNISSGARTVRTVRMWQTMKLKCRLSLRFRSNASSISRHARLTYQPWWWLRHIKVSQMKEPEKTMSIWTQRLFWSLCIRHLPVKPQLIRSKVVRSLWVGPFSDRLPISAVLMQNRLIKSLPRNIVCITNKRSNSPIKGKWSGISDRGPCQSSKMRTALKHRRLRMTRWQWILSWWNSSHRRTRISITISSRRCKGCCLRTMSLKPSLTNKLIKAMPQLT